MPKPIIDETTLRRLRRKMKHPHSVQELMAYLGISRATVYRYIKVLEERGVRVDKVGSFRPAKFKVNRWGG